MSDFWADPRLQWPGSADEMRDALLYFVADAPDESALAHIISANAALYFRLPESDRRAVESAIFARREGLRGKSVDIHPALKSGDS